jgi:hypothetical protein
VSAFKVGNAMGCGPDHMMIGPKIRI